MDEAVIPDGPELSLSEAEVERKCGESPAQPTAQGGKKKKTATKEKPSPIGTSLQPQPSSTIFTLCVLFLVVGIFFAGGHRILLVETAWTVLIVPFCFGMIGSLVLFHFLSSTAEVTHPGYKVGGAAAGFLVLFSLFYGITKEPFLHESKLYRIAHAECFERIIPIAESYDTVYRTKNEMLGKIADNTMREAQHTLEDLASGKYYIRSDELPVHLMPMIRHCKSTYLATQFVLPETFWNQYWSEEYFRLNVEAVKKRHVKLTRIFLLDENDARDQREILNKLILKHVENGINIRIVDASKYAKEVNPDDLRDLLIVDNKITGLLLLEKNGRFTKVEFDINPRTIAERQEIFDRLLANSLSYPEWKVRYYDKWSNMDSVK